VRSTLTSLPHRAGLIYRLHPELQRRFPYEHLWVSIATTDNPEDHHHMERTELRKYFVDFGELPPLNRNETKYNWMEELQALFQAKAGNSPANLSYDDEPKMFIKTKPPRLLSGSGMVL
jgi:hypothetical protein